MVAYFRFIRTERSGARAFLFFIISHNGQEKGTESSKSFVKFRKQRKNKIPIVRGAQNLFFIVFLTIGVYNRLSTKQL